MNGCHDGPARVSAAACHRPEPDLHVVEATGNTIRCGLSSGRIFLQSSRDNDATGNGNHHPSCSEISEVPREILIEVAISGRTRSFRPAGHLLRMAREARVDRRLRRYYLIVRLLPNVFALACLPLSSI